MKKSGEKNFSLEKLQWKKKTFTIFISLLFFWKTCSFYFRRWKKLWMIIFISILHSFQEKLKFSFLKTKKSFLSKMSLKIILILILKYFLWGIPDRKKRRKFYFPATLTSNQLRKFDFSFWIFFSIKKINRCPDRLKKIHF